ncbi:MAG: hypothetical protein VX641_04275 [Planctomycetota bacterium]|nr:hypothetical protein [Planctomycetota bacterium]
MPAREDPSSSTARSVLELAEGDVMVSALEALLKGTLESEVPLHTILGPNRGVFQRLQQVVSDEASERLFSEHGTRIEIIDEPGRAVELGARACLAGRNVMLMLPAGDILRSANALVRVRELLVGAEGFGLLLLIEDDVERLERAAPIRLLDDLAIARIEPNDVSDLRDMVEHGIRLSRAGSGPVAVLASSAILHAQDTITLRPNRIVDPIDVAAAMRRRRRIGRGYETMELLRLARRLELNHAHAFPSPGELAPLGLVAVGPAYSAAEYLLRRFGLEGRVPLLQLGMTSPIDESITERLFLRCENVVVLETRPGMVGQELVGAAEAARRKTGAAASIWWRTLPPQDGQPVALERGDAMRASRVARKISHMLDAVSTGQTVTRGLAPADPLLEELDVPPRGSSDGVQGAIRTVRNLLVATAQWLAERSTEPELEPVALQLEESIDHTNYDRVVQAEIWGRQRFLADGPAAIRECAVDSTPRILVICDIGSQGGIDVVRLATASVPEELGERVSVRSTTLDDLDGVLELLRESVLSDQVTVVVARDGSPPRFDRSAVERSFREVDRLGFTPMQRVLRPAEQACGLRAPVFADLLGTGLDRNSEELETALRIDSLPRRLRRGVLLRLRPLTEQVEVVRTRPPVVEQCDALGNPPAPPLLKHASAAVWRCHVAGWRGGEPGLVPSIIAQAGREMGYRVGCVVSSQHAGPGRGAWAQVLFTRPRTGSRPALPISIPYGEADLLLGGDPVETLRAIGPDPSLRVAAADRTDAVVNIGLLTDQEDHARARPRGTRELLQNGISQRCREGAWVYDLVAPARRTLLTERLIDMMLLGIAYQRGLIPVSIESLERVIERTERGEFGRLLVAFRHGRTLSGGLSAPREPQLNSRDVEPMIRRLVRGVRMESGRRRSKADRFEKLLRESLGEMPGLLDSARGRPAIADFAIGLRHALAWGGFPVAERFARLVRQLYRADSGARSRRMTCYAIYPLAEAMLPRDPIFVATMTSSMEQRLRIRERLAVRHARGDRIERRYLTRLELILARRRFRLDFRTSDWAAWATSMLRPLVPRSWRGSAQERALAREVIELMEEAIRGANDDPEHWERVMMRLNMQADLGRLRSLRPQELRKVIAE